MSISLRNGSISSLFRRTKKGDQEAFSVLFPRLFAKMLSHLAQRTRRLPSGAKDVEDIVVEAIVAIYQSAVKGKLENIQNRKDLDSFAKSILYYQFCMHLRKVYNHKAGKGRVLTNVDIESDDSCKPLIPVVPKSVGAELVVQDYVLWLRNSFGTEADRFLIDALIEGKSQFEIKKMLGWSRATLARRIKRLRKAIEQVEQAINRDNSTQKSLSQAEPS